MAVASAGCGVSFQSGGEQGATSSAGSGGTDPSSSSAGGAVSGTGGSGGTSAGATSGGGGEVGGAGGSTSRGCPVGLSGRPLVFVDASGGAFCIDETEVTVGDYAAFEAAAIPPQTGPHCAWNSTYAPRNDAADCERQHSDPTAPNNAIVCIDWCDARDYCAWAGKRLCGKVGGGASDFSAFDDASQDEWMHACSAGGTLMFPYGNSYDPVACIGDDFDGVDDGPDDHPQGVMDAPSCEGGFSGIFGMSGHTWEWTNVCELDAGDPAQTRCRLRGGSFWDSENKLSCGASDFNHFVRGYANKNHGFRCCADPVAAN